MVQPCLMGIRFGQLELDEERFLLRRDGVRLPIRPKVFDLLVHLIRHRERVVLRDELMMAIWGTTTVGLGSLSGLVNELRQILGEGGRGPSSIRTVHARGYQFVAEVEAGELGKHSGLPGGIDPRRRGDRGGVLATDPGPLGNGRGVIRASFARVSAVHARAVIVAGPPGSGRSSLLEQASADILHAGFEIHRPRVETPSEPHSNALVDRLIDTLVERHGVEALRSAIPLRARELRERVGVSEPQSCRRPHDPLASRQYDERVWRSAAELLRGLSEQRPLALVLDDRQRPAAAAMRIVSLLLRLLGKARIFILCATGCADTDELGALESSDSQIDQIRLSGLNRGQLNELLESREMEALPVELANALADHVRNDRASLESVAGWLQSERERMGPATGDPVLPTHERRMKRVEPNAILRRSRTGSS